MPQHNLRIISNNLVDLSTTTITASSTLGGTSTTNLKNETKSSVWKATSNTATLTVNFGSATTIGGVALPYCSLSAAATINVSAYTGASGGGSLVYTTGTILACPAAMPAGDTPSANNFAYGTSRFGRAWFNENYSGILSLIIVISDATNIEVGKLVVGEYWTAYANTKFGLGTEFTDTTSVIRLDSGDTNTVSGYRYKKLSFELAWLLQSDRPAFRVILQRNGTKYPMFISLFPQVAQLGDTPTTEEYDLEHTHSIYGRMTQVSQLVYSVYTVHANTVEIEEV